MLHNEARELLVKAYENNSDADYLAKVFSISKSSVYRLVAQKRKTGSVELQVNKRGRKPILSEEDKQKIAQLIDEQPDITIDEIRETLSLRASYATVDRAVRKMGYTYKKKSMYASERERLRCKESKTRMACIREDSRQQSPCIFG